MSWGEALRSKTFWSAVGLMGLAVYQITQGQTELAIQSALAALAAFGIRHAIAKSA